MKGKAEGVAVENDMKDLGGKRDNAKGEMGRKTGAEEKKILVNGKANI